MAANLTIGERKSATWEFAAMSDMTVISENDLIESVADALQYISYYHPMGVCG